MTPLACNVCVLVKVDEARELLDKAIELGGKAVKQRALEDADLERLWGGGGGKREEGSCLTPPGHRRVDPCGEPLGSQARAVRLSPNPPPAGTTLWSHPKTRKHPAATAQ